MYWKCDEAFPCGNCKKRNETCQRPKPPSPPASKLKVVLQPDPLPLLQVNSFHIELFYHFEKLTVPTIAFGEIWPVVLQYSFHVRLVPISLSGFPATDRYLQNDFLMQAILSVAAKHLSILRPQDPRYAQASLVMLNKSIQAYRETLFHPITRENCDARLGTSLLINYMSWSDLGFLEGQSILTNPAAGGLDLSCDLLFLLSSGVRQVFFSAYPIFRDHGSVFTTIVHYSPCDHLEEEAERRGTEWRDTWEQLKALFDDPRYMGTAGVPDLNTDTPDEPYTTAGHSQGDKIWHYSNTGWCIAQPLSCQPSNSTEELAAFQKEYMVRLQETGENPTLAIKLAEKGVTAKILYYRICQRLSVLLSLIPDDTDTVSGPGGTAPATLSEARQRDAERYFFTFPMILCFGPFLPLIWRGDSRALVLLYHTYRAARCLLTSERAWWSGERAVVMERLILQELESRGLGPGI